MKLYQHNQDAYEKVMDAFAVQNMAAIVHATGTGKTYVAAAVAENFDNVLVVAPMQFILNEHRKLHRNKAAYITYSKLTLNYEDCGIGYDLIILDEFHRCGAEGWSESVARLLNDNPQAKILGLTATNKRYLEGRDMAEELFDGAVVSTLSLKDAIIRHILRAPKYIIGYYTFGVVYQKYKERIGNSAANDDTKAEAHQKLDDIKLDWSKAYNVHILLKKHLPDYTKRVIVFCQNHSILNSYKKNVIEWFTKAGKKVYKTYYVNHDEETLSRKNMEEFQVSGYDGIKIMFAVDMLNEGVHVPNVDAIVMLRKTISKNVYLQQIGRCLNAGDQRQSVIFDLVANATRTTDLQEWREIKSAYDKSELENGRGICKDNTTDFIIEDYTMELQEFLDNVDNMLPHTFDLWDKRKPLIEAHYARYGHLPTMEEDRTLHIYVMSFKYGTRENEVVSEKSKNRREEIRQYLMTLGFDPYVEDRTAFARLEKVRKSTEERGYYTSYEYQMIRVNMENQGEEYLKAFGDFIDTHYSQLMYRNVRLLTDVLPTIDFAAYGEAKKLSKELHSCYRLAKDLYDGKTLTLLSDKDNKELQELAKVNPYIPIKLRRKERVRRFVEQKDRLPKTYVRKTIAYSKLSEAQRVESKLYHELCELIKEGDADSIAWKEKYTIEQRSAEDVVLDRLEEYVCRNNKYPQTSTGKKGAKAPREDMALIRQLTKKKENFTEEQWHRYNEICKDIITPEKRKKKAEDLRLDMLRKNIAFAVENGYIANHNTDFGKYYQSHKDDDDYKQLLGCYPNCKEYYKQHTEIHALEVAEKFVAEHDRLPVFTVTKETYTARTIRKHIWYKPIWDICLKYEHTAKGLMLNEIRKRKEELN